MAQICPFWLLVSRRSVAGDCHARLLYHQHLCRLQRHRAVPHPARNRECHTGSQLHWVATLELDAQSAVDDIEEFVLLLVLVPVIFAAGKYAQAKQDAADLDECLVVPGMVRPLDRLAYIYELKRPEQRLVIDRSCSFPAPSCAPLYGRPGALQAAGRSAVPRNPVAALGLGGC